MIGILRKNNYLTGLLVGLIIPTVLAGIIYISFPFIKTLGSIHYHKLILLAVVPNVFFIRYYFKVLSYEKSGKAILLMTFALLLIYFIFESKLKQFLY